MKYYTILLTSLFYLVSFLSFAESKELVASLSANTLQQIDNQNQQRQRLQHKAREQQLNTEQNIRFPTQQKTLNSLPKEKVCYRIKQITLQDFDNPNISSQYQTELNSVLKKLNIKLPYCFGVQGLNTLMKQLQNQLIEQGLVTTRVVLKEQNLQSGILFLTVIPGKVGRLIVEDSSNRVRFTPLTNWSSIAFKSGDILNVRDIEQSLENLKRVPTIDANMEILPSANIGESDIKISYYQASPVRFSLGLNDGGSTATGKYQGNATFSIDNLLTMNDLFYADFTHSLKSKEDDKGYRNSYNLNFHYSLPFRYWLLSFDHSTNQYQQEVFGAFQNYLYSGNSKTQKAKLFYTLYRDSRRKTKLWAGLWIRQSDSFIDDESIDVQHRRTAGWEGGIQHKEYFNFGTLDVALSYKQGTGAFHAKPAPEELFNEGTSRPKIVFTHLTLNIPFQIGQQAWQYDFDFNGQWNRNRLTHQDQFSIGGRYSVRGFDGELTLSGDKGWTLQNTLTWQYKSQHQAYIGLDYGKVYQIQEQAIGDHLMGAVLGLRGNLFGLNYDVFAGKPLSKPSGFRTSKNTIGFNLSYQF